MKKIWKWLIESNRWKHLLGGVILGLLSCCWWCTILVGGSVAGALEYKDYKYNKSITAWDWIDFALTFGGSIVGYFIKTMII